MKRGMIGLLFMTVIASWVTEAAAGCPVGFTYIAGSCYKTKGVDCEVDLKHLGNVQQNPKTLECQILSSAEVAGLLFCGNPSANQPPGKVLVFGELSFAGFTPIVDPDQVTRGGSTHVSVIALVPDATLDSLAAQFCPNPSWTGLDFVPCVFTSTLNLKKGTDNTGDVVESVSHSCALPQCETLKWDKKLNRPQVRDYECTGP